MHPDERRDHGGFPPPPPGAPGAPGPPGPAGGPWNTPYPADLPHFAAAREPVHHPAGPGVVAITVAAVSTGLGMAYVGLTFFVVMLFSEVQDPSWRDVDRGAALWIGLPGVIAVVAAVPAFVARSRRPAAIAASISGAAVCFPPLAFVVWFSYLALTA
ncbi:hypothetical protein [Nocardioides sp.]|uniref:hypothetical protein n=1 Tax=Nocardioides sp. TaxID=35761 RepID=UPI003514C5E7